ncbi:MAG: hypothetical protein JWQ89_165 [Devosia sp.]|uniref:DUF4185 domain-containing protein n=1 Tax=Devosia sp. TaxID=1871048 RepID=UPI00263031E6|nr:DUF4185 domain-containing protein [Devosia sp.]MDB5538438.1 hypothetical protein [Devosia sp.]
MRFLFLTVAVLVAASPALSAEYSVTSEKVKALTGPNAPAEMKAPDICGTDLGTMAEIDGRVVLAFGDTFGWNDNACMRFGPNWRSNVIGFTADKDPSDGIVIDDWVTGADGKAIEVAKGGHQDAFKGEQTKIPTAMVAVGDTLYLHYMSVHGFAQMGGVWLCNWSRFISSADGGKSWTPGPEEFGNFKSSFNMLALSAQPGAGNEVGKYVYAVGTQCGRFSGARVGRVEAGKVLDTGAWEYFDGAGWVPDQAQAAEVIKPGAGEGSLVWNAGIGRWMYTTLNELSEAIELRFAERPEGPWSAPEVLARGSDYAQAYGAYMTPSWISEDGLTFYFVMSQFGPYNTYVMKATLTAR